tara:strand:+ start:129 stop:494 length:366 start_codon:yes stop_codon:yes gene_type:complete
MIASTPRGNLNEAMWYFMGQTSRDIAKASGRINQMYGSRYYKSMITCDHYYQLAYKYNYVNPVKAGICRRAEDYPYSTLHALLGLSHLMIPVEKDRLLFDNVEGTLNWLNEGVEEKDWRDV